MSAISLNVTATARSVAAGTVGSASAVTTTGAVSAPSPPAFTEPTRYATGVPAGAETCSHGLAVASGPEPSMCTRYDVAPGTRFQLSATVPRPGDPCRPSGAGGAAGGGVL